MSTTTRTYKKAEHSITRSSAAEYLTFVAAAGQGGVEALYADEKVWLTQKMMGQLYDVETPTINYHLKKVFADRELAEDAVIRNFRITAVDGKNYDIVQDRLFQSDLDRLLLPGQTADKEEGRQ